MANRNFSSGGKLYSMHVMPVLIDCNFVVDSTNANGLGVRSLKGPLVHKVYMQAMTPGPAPAPGSPNLASAAQVAVLASSAISNTGSTVIGGDVDLSPNTLSSVTGFPPGVVTLPALIHAADATSAQARIDAQAAYTDLSTRSTTATISSTLDGQTLSAGVYAETSGTFNLAASGNGTLTLNGSATDLFIFKCSSTLVTGAGGTPTINLTGGAVSRNVYWVVGSSATLNVSGTGTFRGTILASASITGDGGNVDGRLLAGIGAGAVTISAAMNISLPAGSTSSPVAGTPGPGVIVVQLEDNYNRALSGFNSIVSPVSGTALTATTSGVAAIIASLGTATAAQWQAVGLPAGITPAVGVSFIPTSSATIGGSATINTSSLGGSGIASIETVGDSNLSIAPDPTKNQGFGAEFVLQIRDYSGAVAAPLDGSVISLAFLLNNSGNTLAGE